MAKSHFQFYYRFPQFCCLWLSVSYKKDFLKHYLFERLGILYFFYFLCSCFHEIHLCNFQIFFTLGICSFYSIVYLALLKFDSLTLFIEASGILFMSKLLFLYCFHVFTVLIFALFTIAKYFPNHLKHKMSLIKFILGILHFCLN